LLEDQDTSTNIFQWSETIKILKGQWLEAQDTSFFLSPGLYSKGMGYGVWGN
jgi:hypothetical protein